MLGFVKNTLELKLIGRVNLLSKLHNWERIQSYMVPTVSDLN